MAPTDSEPSQDSEEATDEDKPNDTMQRPAQHHDQLPGGRGKNHVTVI